MIRKKIFGAFLVGLLLVGAIAIVVGSTPIASGKATATQAVPYSKLIEFLPEAPSGWEREEPEGEMHTYEGGTWSIATTKYSKIPVRDETPHEVRVVIMDSAFYSVGLMALWQKLTADEYYRTGTMHDKVTVRGFPAFLKNIGDSGELLVCVNDRFIVQIVSTHDASTPNDMEVRKNILYYFALNLIDYNGIAALGESAALPTTETLTTPSEEGKIPGFELVFVFVGILAVAYFLRRSKK